MRRVLVTAACLVALSAPALAQQKPVTYTLNADQVGAMKRAFIAADFWFGVQANAATNSFAGRGFEMQRIELGQLAQEMARQESAANTPAPSPTPAPPADAPADAPAKQ